MQFKKYLILLLIIITTINVAGCSAKAVDDEKSTMKNKTLVAVSIVPQETFIKAVAGDLVDVVVMIPPGYSPENYQPTPKQMTKFSNSKIYFSIGVAAEKAFMSKVRDLNEDMEIVLLADKVREVYPDRNFEEEHEEEDDDDHNHIGRDPHIWLSPKRVKIMIEEIKSQLITLDPSNKDTYEKNAAQYIAELNDIDNEIKETLSGLSKQSFIIYHPSFGYFADDYGLEMVTIEEEGKEATAKKIEEVINFAREENIKFVFYQKEFDSLQAETISKEIDGKAIEVAPLAPNYIENLRFIANKFKEVLR